MKKRHMPKMRRGTHAQARERGVNVPPAYTHVRVAVFPEAHLQATARTAKGKTAYFYHPDFVKAQQERKWVRVNSLRTRISEIVSKIENAAERGRPEAITLRLVLQTGMRNGNPPQGEKESFGASSLRMEHVREVDGVLILDFPGKHGVVQHFEVEDSVLQRWVEKRREEARASLFDHSAKETLSYLRTLDAGLKVHDLRAWLATELAIAFREELKGKDLTDKEVGKIVTQAVANKLGNTPAAVRRAYMDPSLKTE